MPLYDYRCTACDREVEVMHGINDSGPETCEHCGGTMRKALSSPAIHFKGSGWAKKDAARKTSPASGSTSDKPAAKTEDKGAAGAGSKGESGSDAGSSKGQSAATSTTGSTTD